MTFLPVVTRELRVTARKWSAYWVRFAAAALALLICGWSLFFFTQMGFSNMAGKMLFGGATGLAWLYAVIGGVFKTADTLSEEKRDGTLGLLFLTDLKGYDIVLGKIVAASVNWFFGLLALFPILALSLLMGGVAPGEFWREILGLANLLFYSLTLGMFVSSFMRHERKAAGLTIALLVLLLWVPSSLAEWYKDKTGAFEYSPWFILPDVTRPLHYANDYLSGRNPEFYWGSLAGSHAVGWFYLLLASLIVPRTWQQQAGRFSRWQENAEQLAYGKNPARRKRFRERALALNPFYWVAARARGQFVAILLVLIIVFGLFLFGIIFKPQEWRSGQSFFMPAVILHSILKIWIPLAACRRFVEDRRSGALELVLATPMTPDDIIAGQWQALRRQFLVPILFVLVADGLLLFFGWTAVAGSSYKEQSAFLLMAAAGLIIFVADIVALAWLGMWRGMKAKHSYTAWLWCVVQVLVIPWFVFYAAASVSFILVFLPRAMSGPGPVNTSRYAWLTEWLPHIMIVIWLAASLATAILSAWWARRCLRRYFRFQATYSYQPVTANWLPRPQPGGLPPKFA